MRGVGVHLVRQNALQDGHALLAHYVCQSQLLQLR